MKITDWKGGKAKRPAPLSEGEESLARLIRAYRLPAPERQFQFHESRKWQLDFAWPAQLLAVEVEGLTHQGGRHQRMAGFKEDMEKYNALVLRGWTLLRYDLQAINSGQAIDEIQAALDARASKTQEGITTIRGNT